MEFSLWNTQEEELRLQIPVDQQFPTRKQSDNARLRRVQWGLLPR
jgi:hypothetical protein